jgi:hypothetical protein
MSVLRIWVELGFTGAAVNAGAYAGGLRGWFGPRYQNRIEGFAEQSEELTGYRWAVAVVSAVIGFVLPPMALAGLLYGWWMVRTRRACSDRTPKRTWENALARKAELLAEGFPEEDLWAGRCSGGDHFHVKVRVGAFGDIERKRRQLTKARESTGKGNGPAGPAGGQGR